MLSEARKVGRVHRLAVFAMVLTFGALPAQANESGIWPALEHPVDAFLSGMQECGHAFNDDISNGSECLTRWSVDHLLLDAVTRLATDQGQAMFGEHFQIVNSMSYSPSASGLIGGDEVGLEVTLPAVTPGDLDVVVTFAPGTGDNPAVPGVDYVDEPIPVTIPAGTSSAIVTVQLPLNSGLNEARSLSVTVTLAS